MKLLQSLFLACCAANGQAQSFCSSDGLPAPVALVERFISADCEACWSQPEALQRVEAPGALVLDWIVPFSDDAPLSAAANRDALERLPQRGQAAPDQVAVRTHALQAGAKHALRVAHGLPLANYVGASMELVPASGGPWSAVLALVESIPAGVDGTPIARNLVRNTLAISWSESVDRPSTSPSRFLELRPMSLPPGTHPDRLQVVGWVQNAKGVMVAVAQSVCQQGSAD